ncbi:MAG: glycoside hydrolase TIM-barrel-like domain-containing protein [Paracoccaceae bacterium]
MATILLSAAGAAVGAGFGGTVLGLSGAVIGRAIGATVGRAIDQRLLGTGSRAVETGKVDRFRLTGASEGAPIGQVWGRMRVAGQVIWASRFQEATTVTRTGGKGAPRQPSVTTTQYSYSVNMALALCQGAITRVGRIWADGVEISPASLTMRVYVGDETQLPDPKIEAVEGTGMVPAYRGLAYVVLEDLDLTPFGNRVPQFSFEVIRPAQGPLVGGAADLIRGVKGVALIPGTGEYALATTPVHLAQGIGRNVSANVHSPSGATDFSASLRALEEELPSCGSVSLVVSWFGDDLRCGACAIKPKVESRAIDGTPMPWRAGGIARAQADEVVRLAGRPVYGGTPADAAVIEAINALRGKGKAVMFYPFVLMDQLAGNGCTDPWTGAADQPPLPWRGRITLSAAPGRVGSPDRTAAAAAEVAQFFGSAQAGHFSTVGGLVSYGGPAEWSYRRFILHYATLCAMAGGVDAFCIGSELRGLTSVRGAGDVFPAVSALRQLAADVRAILGPATKISYAADWSEYGRYDDGAGNLYFHLDPLWADPNIDFIGVDNYLPLSDWREGDNHADAGWGSIYSLDYLKANVAGGEYYDWYYGSPEERAAQVRSPITDGAYGETWVWRAKDFRGWWENPHFDRLDGVRQASPSPWVPRSKPIWFTEFGCAAIDKGTNEPNKFLDPKSSESSLPHYSTGRRDDLVQMQYLRAVVDFWGDPANNPVSPVYGQPMIDIARAHVWAWDTRPFPQFPANSSIWSDGANYAKGHWISGRTSAQPLSSVVAEICAASGLAAFDVSGLYGLVRGYSVGENGPARGALQPLMIAYGFDAVEREGQVVFRMRDQRESAVISADQLAVGENGGGFIETSRATEAEIAGRVRLNFVEAEGDFETRAVEAILPDEGTTGISQSEVPLSLTRAEGQRIVERWLAEARVSRDGAKFALPPSLGHLGVGDIVRLGARGADTYRIDRLERAGAIEAEAVKVERPVYQPSDESEARITPRSFAPPVPVDSVFLDLPLMSGQEVPHAPHLAVAASPWPGSVAVYSSDQDAGYVLNSQLFSASVIGQTLSTLDAARQGLWDRGPALRVQLSGGALSSVGPDQLLNGANLLAIGDGSSGNWELLQFMTASLVAPDTYDLSMRLRGQGGTDATMPASWPAGSIVVVMDGKPRQIALNQSERDLARHYRIGPARQPYDSPSFTHRIEAFVGVGLRPLSVCHLRSMAAASGDVDVTWVRRTRVDGDSWSAYEVPLGETRELYVLRVLSAGAILREITLGQPSWTYSASLRAADGLAAQPFDVEVAQISDAFGAGPFVRMHIQ